MRSRGRGHTGRALPSGLARPAGTSQWTLFQFSFREFAGSASPDYPVRSSTFSRFSAAKNGLLCVRPASNTGPPTAKRKRAGMTARQHTQLSAADLSRIFPRPPGCRFSSQIICASTLILIWLRARVSKYRRSYFVFCTSILKLAKICTQPNAQSRLAWATCLRQVAHELAHEDLFSFVNSDSKNYLRRFDYRKAARFHVLGSKSGFQKFRGRLSILVL